MSFPMIRRSFQMNLCETVVKFDDDVSGWGGWRLADCFWPPLWQIERCSLAVPKKFLPLLWALEKMCRHTDKQNRCQLFEWNSHSVEAPWQAAQTTVPPKPAADLGGSKRTALTDL